MLSLAVFKGRNARGAMDLYPGSHGEEQIPRASVALDTVRRRLQLYLTALWGRSFTIEPLPPLPAISLPPRPRLRDAVIFLPASVTADDAAAAMAIYRGAAAHAAAHLVYSSPLSPQALQPRQRLLIELIEDARVEYLASARFPGLRRLWSSLWSVHPADGGRFAGLTWRLCRVLLKPEPGAGGEFWLDKAIGLFHARLHRAEEPTIAREIGLRLAHDLGQMRLVMNEGDMPALAAYRDDNRHLWVEERQALADAAATGPAETVHASRPEAILEEATQGRRLAFAEVPRARNSEGVVGHHVTVDSASPRIRYFQTVSENPGTRFSTYAEWFERIGRMRSDWCTVCEQWADIRDADAAVQALRARRGLLTRLSRVVGALRLQQLIRRRALEHGDELDLDAAIRDLIELRLGRVPAARVYERRHRHDDATLAITLLMDISESVNATAPGTGRTVLDLSREAVLLLGHTMEKLELPLAIAGFRSNGRHAVDFLRVKDFDEHFDAQVWGRLFGLTGRYSTRMGAAVRHASRALAAAPVSGGQRLLLLLTDGKPADIDVFDERHLLCDTREAVAETRRLGIEVFCVSLDPQADNYVARIFGMGHFRVLDRLEQLPDVFARLLAGLVKRLYRH